MPTAPRSSAAELPVRPGEEPWGMDELSEVRAQLESEAADLRTEIEEAEAQIAERLTNSVQDAGDDEADTGSKVYEREQEIATIQRARGLLDQTNRALERIETGTYGACESCGKPIGKARLMAYPRATLCVACKQREERR
ncbi:MAG: TraR/DksA family transcriptional regulator [Streptosporangiaceae bacterium]|jgi:DnaK suppressor protein